MDYLIGFLAFVFVLGLIIAVHEFGHFFFARRVNILCREYAFGMGPILLKKKKGETLYTLRAFPIGGFCAIAGEELETDPFEKIRRVKLQIENDVIKGIYLNVDDPKINYPVHNIINYDLFDEKETGTLFMETRYEGEYQYHRVDPQAVIYESKLEYQIAPYNRTLGSKSKGARAMVMFGGPLMNFLLALLVFFIAGLITGFQSNKNILSGMDELKDEPAYVAGLRDGDEIVRLKSGTYEIEVKTWADISTFMDNYTTLAITNPIEITYKRNNEDNNISVNPLVIFYNIGVQGRFTEAGIEIEKVYYENNKMSNNTGLKKGDIITAVEGKSFNKLPEMYEAIRNYRGNNDDDSLNRLSITVLRGSETKDIAVKPYSKRIMETQKTGSGEPIEIVDVVMGVAPKNEFHLGKSMLYSFRRTGNSFTAVFDTLALLFSEESVTIAALSGPVGIFDMTKTVASRGFASLLNWMGLLSVNVGLLNLFPIPALDGGRLLFLGYEAVTKKKPSQKVETVLISVTMVLLLGLMVIVTFNDILRLFR
ncbi:MAG TPA: RIP metalloprotease RseP [Acholeplasmataceae bacterium]|jgi:regulator of sigma E protease|nr:RIP metalloprotease RseP [Acholeplasmataceae bacterium]